MITQSAISSIYSSILNFLLTKMKYGAVGTGTNLPQLSDTQLQNEVYRKQLQDVSVDNVNNEITAVLFLDVTEANGHNLSEFGIFDSSSNGMMLLREVFPAIQKNQYIELAIQVVLKVEVTQS